MSIMSETLEELGRQTFKDAEERASQLYHLGLRPEEMWCYYNGEKGKWIFVVSLKPLPEVASS